MARYPKFTPKEWTTPDAFGRRLRRILAERGLTQSDLAATMWGRDKTTGGARNRDLINCYCKGTTLPSFDTVARMAKVFAMSPAELMPRTIPLPGVSAVFPYTITPAGRAKSTFTVTVPNIYLPELINVLQR